WTNDKTYTVNYRGEDLSYDENGVQNGKVETPDNSLNFTYDTTPPQSTTTVPAAPNGLTINSLPTISGTAEDTGTNPNIAVKLDYVKINITNTSDEQTLKADQTWGVLDDNLYLNCINPQDNWTTWYYTINYPTATWTNNRNYRIRTKAYDMATTAETGTPERTFTIDTSSPTPIILEPNAQIESSLPTISGTCDATDISNVKIRIKRFFEGTTFWWIGDSWDSGQDDEATQVWRTKTGGVLPAWNYNVSYFNDPPTAWVTGTTYYVTARAWDNATNQKDSASWQFRFDNTPPTSSIAAPPVQSGRYKTLPTISGYCSDAPAGVQTLYFTLTDGTSWYKDVTQQWLTAVSTGTAALSSGNTYWYETPISNYVTDKIYTLKVWGKDSVANENYNTYFASLTFIWDSQGPATTIFYPPATKLKSLTTISGTAMETEANNPGIVNNVKIAIRDTILGTSYYNGVYSSSNCWVPGVQWIDDVNNDGGAVKVDWDYSFTVNYETNVWTDNHEYIISAKAYDQTTLNEGSAASVTFTYDRTAPVSTTTYPLNGKYVQPFVTISGTASSDTKDNGVAIHLRRTTAPQYWNAPGDNWSASEQWPAATGAASWTKDAAGVFTISGANGENYYLITRATDTAYNVESLQAERPFTIDSTTPTLTTIKPVADKYYQRTNLVTISGTSVDLAATNPGKFDTNPVKICIKNITTSRYWKDNTWRLWDDPPDAGVAPWKTADWTFYNVDVATAGYWNYQIAESSWTSGQEYKIWVGVVDQATNKIDYPDGDIQGSIGGIRFYCDSDSPVTTVIDPPSGSNINNISAPATISGACDEKPISPANSAGNKLVQLRIKREPTPGLADGTSWWVAPGWADDPGYWNDGTVYVDSWTFNWGSANMVHKTTYYIYVQASDKAQPENLESTGGNIKSQFLYDTKAGTSTISIPPTGEPHYKSLTTISGSCYDDFSSPDKVLVEVYDETGNVYWSTAGWKASGELSSTYYETQNLQPWTTSWINNNHWTNHHKYRVRSKLRDKSQNLEGVKTENTRYFIYDSTNPTSIVIEPANLAEGKNISNMQTISGTCVDEDPGLVVGSSVAFRQTDVNDADLANSWWNGTDWTGASPLWMGILPENFTLLTDTTYQWKINTNTATWQNDTWYRVYSLSIDKAGNTQNNGSPDNYNRFKYV
ncbi:MAG: hypothetical protein COT43_00320, partial [Candidatus Marinimicrobia bacterium CG08_land_8_20_14_0_20_45_22]